MTLDAVLANKALIGAAAFALLFIVERAAPKDDRPADTGRLVRNGALWLLLMLLSPLIVLPLTAFASSDPLWTRPTGFAAPSLIAGLLLLDLWAYWVHRAYHEIAFLRRFHRVHHLDERLDTTSAVRFHPGEVAISALLRMAPIVLFAIPFDHVLAFETVLLVGSLFHHSNIRLPTRFERALSRFIVTPSIHWVHHHAVAVDTNSNYAAVLSLWDVLFRTRSPSSRTIGMKIGVEGVEDGSLIGLLLAPLKKTGGV